MDKITLKAARVNAGFTISEVSEILHRAPSTISQWESEESTPSITDALKMADLYERPIDGIKFKEAMR